MEASFFKGATNIRIGGNTQFHSVVAGRDVHQVNNLGDTYNTNSNNKNKTVIKDSYNDNSQHIVGSGARRHPLAGRPGRSAEISEDDSSGWTEDSTTDSSEEEYVEEDRRGNRRQQPARKNARARSSKARPKPRSGAADVRSAPNMRKASPPARSASPGRSEVRPAPEPVHAASAPAVPTQATSTQAPLSPSLNVTPHLAVPPTPSVNTSSTSLTQSVATSTGVTPTTPSLTVNRPALAPVPSTLGSSLGSSLTVPASVQLLSASVVDLSARYRYLVTRNETRDEIRRKLVNVAQSTPRDKFFALKDQATRANTILGLVEGSKEKIQRNEEFVKLSLESHAVAFIVIMTAEKQTPDEKRIFNLLKILREIEALVTDIVQNDGLSKWHPFKRGENKNSVKSYRRKLESWLKEFQNDKVVTIDYALHQASNALSKALYAEQQYAIAVQEPPQEMLGSSRMQMPVSSPGSKSTSVSNVTRSAVALGSGSAAVINGEGSGNKLIHQNSHNNNSVNIYR